MEKINELISVNWDVAFAIVGLTQAIKMTGKVQAKFLPIVSIAFGALLMVLKYGLSATSIIFGLILGVASAGVVNRIDSYIKPQKAIKPRKPELAKASEDTNSDPPPPASRQKENNTDQNPK